MESLYVAFTVLLFLMFFLGLGVWVFAGLLLVSSTALVFLIDMSPHRIGTIMAPLIIRSATSWELSAIPMFIWMGEIMLRTDISTRLFRGLSPLTYHLPGRLLHTNIFGSALFAAISGSSAATTATVGKITMSELAKRGYSRSLTYGSLAGAGSLGLLIPPSIVMIVYGVLAEVSISRLFAAGVFPGIMIAASDTRHYSKVADNSFRFNPFSIVPEDMTGFHGTNESIAVDSFVAGIKTYVDIINEGSSN